MFAMKVVFVVYRCDAFPFGGSAPTFLRIVTFVQPVVGAIVRTLPWKMLSETSSVSPPGANLIAWDA